jgi:putative PIN family toxin of toxin-antitoxin system
MGLRAVLDTSVIVAGLRSRRGSSFRLLKLVEQGALTPVLSVALVLEYEAVLKREAGELGLTAGDVGDFLDSICTSGDLRKVHFLWRPQLRDANDEFVLEVAVESGCGVIMTHNARDFAPAKRFGVRVAAPAVFLRSMGEMGGEQ